MTVQKFSTPLLLMVQKFSTLVLLTVHLVLLTVHLVLLTVRNARVHYSPKYPVRTQTTDPPETVFFKE